MGRKDGLEGEKETEEENEKIGTPSLFGVHHAEAGFVNQTVKQSYAFHEWQCVKNKTVHTHGRLL